MRLKSFDLVRLLMSNPSTGQALADQLDVSLRSIRSYVKEINETFPDTITSSKDGYEINPKKALDILALSEDFIPQTSSERSNFIITKLLMSNRRSSINIYDLSEEMYVSVSTLKNDLRTVKSTVSKFDLELVIKSDHITVEGLEKNKRQLLSKILYEESNVNFLNLDSLQSTFANVDITFIRKTILNIFDKHHYFINDYSLINIILHLTISIVRLQNLSSIPIYEDDSIQYPIDEYQLALEISQALSKKYNIEYNTSEINEISLLIAARATSLDYNKISKTNIESYIGKETLDLVNHLIEAINNFYHEKLFDDDFIVRFALHIRNLLIRAKHKQFSKNPLAAEIKKSSPLIYETSVSVAAGLKKLTGISINDDEIAFIAFHIGSAIETLGNYKEKSKVVLYSPSYYNLNNKIVNFIKSNFDKEIMITLVVTDESQLDSIDDVDFILTSIPISKILVTPIFQISYFPNENDKIELSNFIHEIRKDKAKQKFRSYLEVLIHEENFEINNSLNDSDSTLRYMANKLIENNYANENFLEQVLEREKMSSTAFSEVAIPHSTYMDSKKTAISVLISKSGIKWNNTIVNLVVMMCFKKKERYIFNEIFEDMTMILSEKSNIHKLINTKDYKEFIDTMVSLLYL